MNGYRKELVSPDGEKYVSTSAVETNDLVYGSGYREAPESTGDTKKAPAPASDKPTTAFATGGEVSP